MHAARRQGQANPPDVGDVWWARLGPRSLNSSTALHPDPRNGRQLVVLLPEGAEWSSAATSTRQWGSSPGRGRDVRQGREDTSCAPPDTHGTKRFYDHPPGNPRTRHPNVIANPMLSQVMTPPRGSRWTLPPPLSRPSPTAPPALAASKRPQQNLQHRSPNSSSRRIAS